MSMFRSRFSLSGCKKTFSRRDMYASMRSPGSFGTRLPVSRSLRFTALLTSAEVWSSGFLMWRGCFSMMRGMVTGVEAEGERESYPASRPEPFPRGERHHVVHGRRTREQHHEPINAERDPHRLAHARQVRQEAFVNGPRLLSERTAEFTFLDEATPLFIRIGQLDETVREFETSGVELDALGETRVVRARACESGLRRGVAVQERRRLGDLGFDL